MKSQYANQIRTCATEWFKDHKAEFYDIGEDQTHPSCTAPLIKHLRWKKPGTVIYWIDYIISGHFLCVYGDAGDAIYAWSENLTWEFLKTCDLDYFHGKCQASEAGRDFVQWNQRALIDAIDWWCTNDRSVSKARIQQIKDEARGTTCATEWLEVCSNYPKIFPEPVYEFADYGKSIHVRCVGHWVGIQMATGNTEAMLKRYEI